MNSKPGVIFDVDGVLVDSYAAHFLSYQMLGQEQGLSINANQFATYFGRTTRETLAEVWQERGFNESEIADLDTRKEKLFREILVKEFPAMEGAGELVDALHNAGFRLAVGSSGPPENVALIVKQLGREHLFHSRVTGIDVIRGKPDPQVFLIAAERLGLSPHHCLVIEDAAVGITAAATANMATVGLVSTGRTQDELATADLVVDSLRELNPIVIRQLIETRQA